jgi:hypothetical protein
MHWIAPSEKDAASDALEESTSKDRNGHSSRRGSRVDDPSAHHAEGVAFLTPNTHYDHLLSLPEGADVGQAISNAVEFNAEAA